MVISMVISIGDFYGDFLYMEELLEFSMVISIDFYSMFYNFCGDFDFYYPLVMSK